MMSHGSRDNTQDNDSAAYSPMNGIPVSMLLSNSTAVTTNNSYRLEKKDFGVSS